MSLWKKAISVGATAALLGSLFATALAPTVSAAAVMAPTSGPNTGGTLVSISGASGYSVSTGVTVCGTAASVTSVAPDGTALTFVTPDISPFIGLCPVVTTSPATVGLPGFFASSSAPGPVTLTPASGKNTTSVTLSAPGQTISATGLAVTVNGLAASAIRVNSETVQFIVPGSSDGITTPGACPLSAGTASVPVAVTSAGGTIVGIPAFTCNPTTAYSMIPTSGPTGTVVQLSGGAGSFDLGTQVLLNTGGGAVEFTLNPTSVAADGSRLTFVIPSGALASTVYAVSVTAGTAGTSGTAGNFTVSTSSAAGNVAPSTASNAGGTVIQVTQSSGGLTTASRVALSLASGGPACAFYSAIVPTSVAADGKSLTFVMPSESNVTTNCGAITNHVVYVWIVGAAANAGSVTYTQPAGPPVVTAVSPNSGSRLGGNTVTITGSSFVSGATVLFGAAAATSVTFVSATQLTAVAPAGVGVVPVTVRNPDNQSGQLPSAYTYTDTGFVCGNATALNVTTTGPFTTSTKVAKLNQYVTYAMGCGTAAAGQVITIQRAVRASDGTWSAFTAFTSRVANSGGTVYYYVRSSSAAWWSFRAAISGFTSPARQARWQ